MNGVDLLRALAAAAGLVLPGLGWALAARWPLPGLAAGVVSSLALFAGVLAGTVLGIPVTAGALAAWLTMIALPGWGWAWRRGRPDGASPRTEPDGPAWLALPAVFLLAVAGWRALLQPLSGADTGFRWNLLAGLIVERGGLAGYPAVTTADFTAYFWADGIAPLVASAYAWVYLVAGRMDEAWTALVVFAQVAGLLAVLFGLGRHWQGNRGGWFAVGLAGATMLLQFAFNLGQETGLTALGAGGMVLYLLAWDGNRAISLLVPAALCAALAACAREYGAAAGLAGALWVAGRSRAVSPAVFFAAVAAVLPTLWVMRVWLLTGNPAYAHSVGGFPTNPVFDAWMRGYRETYGGPLWELATWGEVLRLLAVTALPALLGLLAGTIAWRARPGWMLVLAVALGFAAAWLASVPYTAGGLFYSMRVLSPLLLLGCAWGGACLARWVPGRTHLAGVLAGLTLFAADASLRAWTIPGSPYARSPAEWPVAGDWLRRDFDQNQAPFLRQVARAVDGRVLSDSAGLREFFRREGKTYSPLWSPDVAWLFAGTAAPDASARLRALGYSHLLLKRSANSFDFLGQHGAWRSLDGQVRPVMANDLFVLFEFVAKAPPEGSR